MLASGGRESKDHAFTVDTVVHHVRTMLGALEPLERYGYSFGRPRPKGTRHASEVHELGLFTKDELMGAFRSAGLQADYDPKGLTNRGLYIAHIT